MSTTDELDLFKAQIWQALESDNLHTVILEARRLFPNEKIYFNLGGTQTIPDYIEELKERIRDYCYNTKLMSEVIFGYTYCDEWPRPYSWDFKVKSKCRVDFNIYYERQPESTPYMYLSNETIDEIERILNDKRSIIDSLSREVLDCNMGGRYETFTFLDRKIRSKNTARRTEEEVNKLEEGLKEYARQQNILLDLMESIAPQLKPYGFNIECKPYLHIEWRPISDCLSDNMR